MNQKAIHSFPELVDVYWRDDLKAVHLKWHAEYNDGMEVQNAVWAAIDYVNRNGVKNWLGDISTSSSGLSQKDLDFVSGEIFRDAIRASTLTRFVLIPPLPETKQDTSWLSDWEKNTLAAFGDGVQAKLENDIEKIRVFFDA